MATWPSSNKPVTTTTDADSDSISGARADINKAITNQIEIIDMFNIPGSPTDNYILKYNASTGVFDMEADAGGRIQQFCLRHYDSEAAKAARAERCTIYMHDGQESEIRPTDAMRTYTNHRSGVRTNQPRYEHQTTRLVHRGSYIRHTVLPTRLRRMIHRVY